MPKINGSGQAAVMSESDYAKIRKQIKTDKYRLLLDLAWYTGERWGALVQLKVDDIYASPSRAKGKLIFKAMIRKHRPDGTADDVIIPVHENLKASIESFNHGDSQWLFPSRCGSKPITWKNAYNIFKKAIDEAGLSAKGISTHSTRRSLVNKLRKRGIDKAVIRKITGHRSDKGLEPYYEIEMDEVEGAIATL